MIAPVAISILCLLGLYVSAKMQRKAALAARGALAEPSVVRSPHARIFGISNSVLGIAYYACLLIAAWFLNVHVVFTAAFAAASVAAAASLYLAYSLIFVTRLPCVNCWTGHAVNWLLLSILATRL